MRRGLALLVVLVVAAAAAVPAHAAGSGEYVGDLLVESWGRPYALVASASFRVAGFGWIAVRGPVHHLLWGLIPVPHYTVIWLHSGDRVSVLVEASGPLHGIASIYYIHVLSPDAGFVRVRVAGRGGYRVVVTVNGRVKANFRGPGSLNIYSGASSFNVYSKALIYGPPGRVLVADPTLSKVYYSGVTGETVTAILDSPTRQAFAPLPFTALFSYQLYHASAHGPRLLLVGDPHAHP